MSATRRRSVTLLQDEQTGIGELVLFRDVAPAASVLECLWFAWDEAQWAADLAYAAWRRKHATEAYVVYRAAQDRADAAQDALADRAARESENTYGADE
jgi:acyl-CoA reductase-like NAD-dependent aldehyde dehydrogenase